MRQKYMDRLIDDYVDSLYETLQKFDVHEEYVPNIETLNSIIRQELRDRAIYGLGICMWLLPAVTAHPDKSIDLDTVTMDDLNNDNHEKTMTSKQTPEYHARMKDTVMEFYTKGILNRHGILYKRNFLQKTFHNTKNYLKKKYQCFKTIFTTLPVSGLMISRKTS